jgi:15-cis-phytoene synthase
MAAEILAVASETLGAPSQVARDDAAAMIGAAPLITAAALPAGLAYAFTGLIRAFPLHAARGQVFLPSEILRRHGSSLEEALSGRATPALLASLAEWRRDARRHLEKAQAAVTHLPESLKPAFLPLALVKPHLDAKEKRECDPFHSSTELPQWRRQWALWRGLPKSAPAR